MCGFAAALEGADLVLTGEGRVDHQAACGKTISGVTALAIVVGEQLGVWGELEIVPLGRKRG